MQEVLPGFRAAFGSLLPRTESTPLFLDKVLSTSLRFPVSTAPWPPGTLVSTRAYPRPRCTRDRHPGLGCSRSSPPSQLEFSVVLRRHVRERADSGRTMKRSSQTCPQSLGGFWGPASWVGIPFEIVDLWGGVGPS